VTVENLNCVKDAYFYAQRFQDLIAVVSRIPRDARGRGSRLLLTLSYALLGRTADAERARAEVLARYPSTSAGAVAESGLDLGPPRGREPSPVWISRRATSSLRIGRRAVEIKNAPRLPDCLMRPTGG
jgi:hypothetical protein